jgi:cyclic-di-GMP phosphodiesterase TipF (flagellum assembly factor)
MRKITAALLSATYLCLSALLGVWLWQAGAGWGAAIAGFVGLAGLALALDGHIRRIAERRELTAEIDAVREAHVILADQIEQLDSRITVLSDTVQEDSEELTDEVRMLEDLVQRLSLAPAAGAVAGEDDLLELDIADEATPRDTLFETIREALAENRVDLYLQPVVSLPQRRTIYYESYSRLRDESGRVMMPAEYLTVAEPRGLVSSIDNLLLFRCVQIVRRLANQDRQVGIFCNISLASLADEAFFPQFLDFLAENQDLRGALIFELGQAAYLQRGSVEARNMAKLADLGFKFSLDKVTDLFLDFQDLSRSDVKFLKISADVLLAQIEEHDRELTLKPIPHIAAADFANLARRYGVEVIAEKVETERQVVDVLELGVALGEGHLFGQPRAIRDAVLAEADPPAGFITQTLRRAAG